MQNPPENPLNHNKNNKKNIKDISFNRLIIDICGSNFINPFFNILQPPKKKKNTFN